MCHVVSSLLGPMQTDAAGVLLSPYVSAEGLVQTLNSSLAEERSGYNACLLSFPTLWPVIACSPFAETCSCTQTAHSESDASLQGLWLPCQGLPPRVSSLPTCMESALIISPWSRFPISIASLDFPVPVAPKITTNDGTIALRKAHCTLRADAAMMLLPLLPQLTPARMRSGRRDERRGSVSQATCSRYCGNIDWWGGSFIFGDEISVTILTF